MSDLFDPPKDPDRAVRSEPPDFWSMHARQLLGMPEEWRWTSLEAMDGGGGRRFSKVTGAIADGVRFKSGPRKGQLNWRHRHDEKTVIIDFDDHERFKWAWEAETGICSRCGGDGREHYGWSKESGNMSRPCSRCGATGQMPKLARIGGAR